jgi:putative SOS response-associated peptidase YedK
LVPYWAKDPKIAYRTINARTETVDAAPSYREAFKRRRCLIPADGFYEWKKVLGGKIPYSIGMKDDSPFVFAGPWEGWKDPATDEWLRTCTIITGEPNELVAQIHTRMPVTFGRFCRPASRKATSCSLTLSAPSSTPLSRNIGKGSLNPFSGRQ